MNNKKKLLQIFGPIVAAFVILFGFFSFPFKINFADKGKLYVTSLSQSANVFKGTQLKQQAFKSDYVPFFGSSEWSRIDSFNPVVLAHHYQRGYQPFLLGARGSQSLSQFWGMQGINSDIKDKKAVFVISPQWFVPQGIDPDGFDLYYSNIQSVTWLEHAHNDQMDRFAAQRLLDMPASHTNKVIEQCLLEVAAGQKINKIQRVYLRLKSNELRHEEELFSLIRLRNRRTLVNKAGAKLPAKYDFHELTDLADAQGKMRTTNNKFGIGNHFWTQRLVHSYQRLQNKQKKLNYESSPEYRDFQLVLAQLAKDHVRVLFVIPPVNQKWAEYTGLSSAMLERFDQKINYQLRSQGFTDIADFSHDGQQKYFMNDTIHFGWKGWLLLDSYVRPFMSLPNKAMNYHINSQFYSLKWQRLHGQQLDNYLLQ